MSENADKPVSILCHSNGTKVLAEILPKIDHKFEWIFLCASICHLNDVKALRVSRRSTVSDASTKDWWPIWAEALRPSMFQATGVTGFNCYPIVDRSYPYKHGDGVERAHIEKWIFPTIATGKVIYNETKDVGFKKHAPVYLRRGLIALPVIVIAAIWMLYS